MPTAAVDLASVQGLIHHPYPLACSRYLLFRIGEAAAGRAFLARVLPLITFATADPTAARCVNAGLTFEGLSALGVASDVLTEFPEDFKEGPAARVLGDLAESAPERWWAGQFRTRDIHLVLQLTAADDAGLAALSSETRQLASAPSIIELFPSADQSTIDGRHLGDRRLHFGYRDGISQPDVAWSDAESSAGKINFRHFVLGHSVPEISSNPKFVASRPMSAKAVAIAFNGSYGILRWLHQDVAAFNKFLQEEGPRMFPNLAQPDAEELLAAKLIGRWRDGTPLVLSDDRPRPELDGAADFGYQQTDPDGLRCPFAAHVRVVNPRDQKLGFAEFGFVPRVIRRGTPFGKPLFGADDDGQLRGLVGLFLCSSISGQFYRLMSWMKRTDFSPSFTNPVGQDPLADRHVPGASAGFDIPAPGGTRSVQLIQFTRTLGTALLFLPGRDGFRLLSSEN